MMPLGPATRVFLAVGPTDLRKGFGHSHQDRGVRIVAARVHHADLVAFVFGFGFRRERQIDFFRDWQCIHVGAQRDYGSGLSSAQQCDDTGASNRRLNFKSQRAQMLGNDFPGAMFTIR